MGIFGQSGRKKPRSNQSPVSNTFWGFIVRLCGRWGYYWSEERRQTFLYARKMQEVEKKYKASKQCGADDIEYTSARILLLLRYPKSQQAVQAKQEYDSDSMPDETFGSPMRGGIRLDCLDTEKGEGA